MAEQDGLDSGYASTFPLILDEWQTRELAFSWLDVDGLGQFPKATNNVW